MISNINWHDRDGQHTKILCDIVEEHHIGSTDSEGSEVEGGCTTLLINIREYKYPLTLVARGCDRDVFMKLDLSDRVDRYINKE